MYDIIERTGQAEYYLREASRSGLPMPSYVTVSAHDHGTFRSSQIGIQLTNAGAVREWAGHFGAVLESDATGASTTLESFAHNDVRVYCGAEETAPVAS